MPQDYDDHVSADRPLDGNVVAPHRGQMILVLGILSVLGVASMILGPMAWIMGNNDLKEMAAGRMDRAGRDNTNTGRICGMIATILSGVALVFVCIIFGCMGFGIIGAAATPRPAPNNFQPVRPGRNLADPVRGLLLDHRPQSDVVYRVW